MARTVEYPLKPAACCAIIARVCRLPLCTITFIHETSKMNLHIDKTSSDVTYQAAEAKSLPLQETRLRQKSLICRMDRHISYPVPLLLLLCLSVAACGRLQPKEPGQNRKRSLLQNNVCDAIRNCKQCFTTKDEDSITMLVCRTCASGYQPTKDLTACGKALLLSSALSVSATLCQCQNAATAECSPGYFASGSGNCTICPVGSYCLGGSEPATACAPRGLTTLTRGSRSMASCGKL